MKISQKRLLAAATAAMMMLSLAACGGSSGSAAATTAAPAAAAAETTAAAGGQAEAAAPAGEAEYIFSWASTSADNKADPNVRALYQMKEDMEAKSNGRIEVQLYFGTMGNDRECIEAAQMGQIVCSGASTTVSSMFINELSAFDCPYLISDINDVTKLLDDEEFYAYLNGLYEKNGMHLVALYSDGFRQTTSNKDIRSFADVKGLDIRVPESEIPMALWRAFGANPTPITYAEVYTALQRGVCDAQENPVALIYAARFYEQQKYLIMTNHQAQFYILFVNTDWYDALPEDLQGVVTDVMKDFSKNSTNWAIDEQQKQLEEMHEKTGIEIVELDDARIAEFAEAAAPAQKICQEKWPEAYEQLTAAVARVHGN